MNIQNKNHTNGNGQSSADLAYQKLISKMHEHFLIEDTEPIKVIIATYIANHFDSDPLWLFVIAPPASLKTELINPLSGLDDIYELSDLSEKTLLSGYNKGQASLIYKLDKKIVTMKDFTTVLEMRRERRSEIIAQLREIYDGRMNKSFGTGDSINWKGKIGIIAGVTPAIDHCYAIFQALGERFIQVRIKAVDALASANKAIQNTGNEEGLRTELSQLMSKCCSDYVKSIGDVPKIPEPIKNKLASLATFCVKARSHIHRDNSQYREIDSLTQSEAPPRFTKQLALLAKGLAVFRGSSEVDMSDYGTVYRVALDCLPPLKKRIIEQLINEKYMEDMEFAGKLNISLATVCRALEDLAHLSLLEGSASEVIDARRRQKWLFTIYAEKLIRQMLPNSTDETTAKDNLIVHDSINANGSSENGKKNDS